MKVALTFLALVALCYSAPQARKLFHEHYEDFISLIRQEAGQDMDNLLEQYSEYEEFQASLDYLRSPNFRNLVYELEDLPEFKAVVEFLEGHEIDINYFIESINNFVDNVRARKLRQDEAPERDVTAFIHDSIALFPQEALTALNEQKTAEDDAFRRALESFQSEEWEQLFDDLWNNETFLNEIITLKQNGIDVHVLLAEIRAVVGIYNNDEE